jgi:hypothetical protein
MIYRWIRYLKPVTALLGRANQRSLNRIEIDITYRCNLRCPDCNRAVNLAATDVQLSTDQIRRFVQESIESNVKWESIRILGGEPTLHADLLDILSIISVYRNEHSPDTNIVLVTNGTGAEVKSVLEKIPADICIDNTEKYSEGHDHVAFSNAPRDHAFAAALDYSNACMVTRVCGIGLTPFGYYCCAVAGSIDRVFGYDMSRKVLPKSNDLMIDQMQIFCSLCGHFLLDKCAGSGTMSRSWLKAIENNGSKRPE